MQSFVLSILVDNHAGVLARVASLFNRRGFNIDSLTVSKTNVPETSRITVVTHGEEETAQQIIKQTEKLTETKSVFMVKGPNALLRELLLIKLSANEKTLTSIREVADIYKAKIIDLSPDSIVLELTGEPHKINAFLEILLRFDIIEMCRTGVTALERGIPSKILLKEKIYE